MLQINDLSFRWTPTAKDAISQLSLMVKSGEWLALVGDNGAGKSTLLRLIAGLLSPTKGDVNFEHQSVSHYRAVERAQQIGILFQEAEKQIFHSSVKEEIRFGLRRLKLSHTESQRRLQQALDICYLTEVSDKHPLDLHSAQRRMVAVACLTAVAPKLLLLDEPSRDFDAHWLGCFENWLQLQRKQGTTVIAISHDLDFVARNFQRAVHLSKGCLIADGAVADVLYHPELQPDSRLPAPTLQALSRHLQLPIENNAKSWSDAFLARRHIS